MRVMILVKATADSEGGAPPSAELLTAMGRFNEELMNAGVLLAGEGLKPTALGKRVRCDGESRSVSDGPFGPPEEQLAGFWLWQVKDMDEALAWAKRCPNPMPGPSVLEIRSLFEAEDFVDTLPEDVAALEQTIRDRLADR